MKRRGPFRTLGMRMQDFGRNLMRQYVPPESAPIGQDIASPPPAWQGDTQTPLIWNEPQAVLPPIPTAENLPFDTSSVEAPPSAVRPAAPPPVQQPRPAAPVVQRRKGDAEEKIDPRLLAILGAHKEREERAAEVREKRHAAAAASELQRQIDESQPDAPIGMRRRNRASFDYVETKALMPAEDEPGFTPLPKTPTETVQAERQPDQPKDDDDSEESRAAETETLNSEASTEQPAPTAEGEFTETADLSSPVSAAQQSVQREFETQHSPSQPVLETYSPDSGNIEPSYTAPIAPEIVPPVPAAPNRESAPGSEMTVQRSAEIASQPVSRPTPPTSQAVTRTPETPASRATVQPTIQRRLDTPQTELPASASLSDADSEPLNEDPSNSDESGFSPAISQQPIEQPAQSPDIRGGNVGQAETPRTAVRRQVEKAPEQPTVQRQAAETHAAPQASPERSLIQRETESSADTLTPQQPTVQREIGETAASTTTQPTALPIVQRQIDAEELSGDIAGSESPIETERQNQALSAPMAEPSGDIPAQPENINNTPATVQQQVEAKKPISETADAQSPVETERQNQALSAPTAEPSGDIPVQPENLSHPSTTVQRQTEANETLPSEVVAPPDEHPTIQRQTEQTSIGVNEPEQASAEHPLVQRQSETTADIIPSEAVAPSDEHPTIQRQTEQTPTGVNEPEQASAERPIVQRQSETTADIIPSEAVAPSDEHPTIQRQTEQTPTGVNEPEQASAERPIVQRQSETTADIIPSDVVASSDERPNVQRQTEQAPASISEQPQISAERPLVRRQIEVPKIAGNSVEDQNPINTVVDNSALSAPIAEADEPSQSISTQAENRSAAPAEAPIIQRQIDTSSDNVTDSTAIVPDTAPIEHVSQQAEPAPSRINEPSQTSVERPIVQRQVEQPRAETPIQADVQRDIAGDEVTSTIVESQTALPADVEALHNALAERPTVQRDIAQTATNGQVGQGEIEANQAVSGLPVSQPAEQTPTFEPFESTANSPVQPSAAESQILGKPEPSVQRTPEASPQTALPEQAAETTQHVSASEPYSETPAEAPEQETAQPNVFEALIAAGMVSAPEQANTIQRKSAAPETTPEPNSPLAFDNMDSEEEFTADTSSEQPAEQPLNVFEAMVEAGMVAPPESRTGRAEIARKVATPSTSPTARESAPSSSNFPDHIPVQYANAPQVVMRAETVEEPESASQEGGESNMDVDKLARDVYSALRQRLRVEKERRG